MASSSSSSQKELEVELRDAGNRLLMPPSSIEELINLLNKVECLLSMVEQAPSRSMQDALLPSMKALIANELLRHSYMDVKASVVSCICEITRITAPDAPYNDEQMKEIFQLTVMAFEKLSYVSGHCYTKAIHILSTTAKVRSCLLMMDLECDALIVKMFRQFLNTIRSNHPHAVFSDMETIMTLVIEESEEISIELLSLLLSSVKKENQKVSPLAWKLGEKVLQNCAATLKPYLPEAVKSMSQASDNYAEVVTSICQDAPGKEHVVAEELAPEAIRLREVGLSVDGPSKSVRDDGTAQTRNDDNSEKENSLKTLERCHQTKQQKSTDARIDSQPGKLEQETDPTIPMKRGRKPNSLLKPEEGYDHCRISGGRKSCEIPYRRTSHEKKISDLPKSSNSKASEAEKETMAHCFAPKATHSESMSASDVPEKDFMRAQVMEKASASEDVALKEESKGATDSKEKQGRDSRIKELAAKTNVERTPALSSVVLKKEDGVLSGPEGNQESLAGQMGDKKQIRGKTTSGKRIAEESGDKKLVSPSVTKSLNRDVCSTGVLALPAPRPKMNHLDEASKRKYKRKWTTQKEEDSGMPFGHEELVGCRIKVWWPLDKMFYEGTISSFDPFERTHKVLYADGDEEILNLYEERWELVGDTLPDQVQEADPLCPAALSDKPRKKKPKTKLESSVKQQQNASLSKSVGTSADISKIGAPKSGSKATDGSRLATLCIVDKSKDDKTKMGDLLKDDVEKSTGKTETEKPSTIQKFNHDTTNTVNKSEGFNPRVKSESHGSSTVTEKHRLSEEELSGDVGKGKLSDSVNAQESETKSGKKRRRLIKGGEFGSHF